MLISVSVVNFCPNVLAEAAALESAVMKRNPLAITIVAMVIIGFICWVFWYNSPDQKLQRCITAEGQEWENKVQTDPQAQRIHDAGGDPPMALALLDCDDKLGIKP